MALCIDSVTPAAIPKGTPVVAGYIDGPYGPNDPYHSGWTAEAWNSFPGSQMVTITVLGTPAARVYDIESGDGTPAQGAAWAKAEIAAGRRPTLYANASTWADELDHALAVVGLSRVNEVDGWVAQYNDDAIVPPGFVAHQYLANQRGVQGSYIDYSVTNGVWPSFGPIPTPTPPSPTSTFGEGPMIAPTPSGNGFWQLKSDGSIITHGDAQYLGGVNVSQVNGQWDGPPDLPAGQTCVSIAAHPTSQGYWVESNVGNIYAYGAAPYEK